MENIILTLKTKQVGNSLAIFIPADVRDELQLKANEEVVTHIHRKKRKDVKEILSMYGANKGKKITWKCEEDRYDEHRD